MAAGKILDHRAQLDLLPTELLHQILVECFKINYWEHKWRSSYYGDDWVAINQDELDQGSLHAKQGWSSFSTTIDPTTPLAMRIHIYEWAYQLLQTMESLKKVNTRFSIMLPRVMHEVHNNLHADLEWAQGRLYGAKGELLPAFARLSMVKSEPQGDKKYVRQVRVQKEKPFWAISGIEYVLAHLCKDYDQVLANTSV